MAVATLFGSSGVTLSALAKRGDVAWARAGAVRVRGRASERAEIGPQTLHPSTNRHGHPFRSEVEVSCRIKEIERSKQPQASATVV